MLHNAFIQFHRLPPPLKAAVSSPHALAQIDALEAKYHVALADVVVRLMVKEVPLTGLSALLRSELNVAPEKANALSDELRNGVLKPVLSYLGTEHAPAAPPPPAQPHPIAPAPAPLPLRPAAPPPPKATALPAPSAPPVRPAPPPPRMPPSQTPKQTLRTPPPSAPPQPPDLSPMQRPKIPPHQFSRVASGKAAYYVFAEDEAEIARHRDRLNQVSGESPTSNLSKKMDDLMNSLNLTFPDEVLAKRFRGLLLSRLRDVRTADEFRELLARSPKVGGIGYDATTAERIVSAAEKISLTLHDRNAAGYLAEPSLASPARPEPTLVAPPSPPPPKPVVEAPPAAHPPASPPSPAPPVPHALQPEPARPAPPPPVAPRPPMRRAAPPLGRRVIQDIKVPQRPVSPIEELGLLTLDDLRGMGKTLNDAVAKIVEKVQLLAEDSYEKRAEGIAAWRRSDIHRLYLAMGRESMAGNKSIEEVMTDRRRQNLPYLTAAEFAAIADLNHQLVP